MRVLKGCRLAIAVCVVLCSGHRAEAGSSRAEEIRRDISAILSRPEFVAEERKATILNWIGERVEAMLRALGELLERLFRSAGIGSPAAARILTWIVIGLIITAVLGALVAAVTRALRRRRKTVASQDGLDATAVEAGNRPDPDRLLEEARALLSAGDTGRAFRAAFSALLIVMNDAGLIRYDSARTTGEYIRDLARRGQPYGAFRSLALTFDKVAYGHASASAGEVEECLRMTHGIRALAISPQAMRLPDLAASQ